MFKDINFISRLLQSPKIILTTILIGALSFTALQSDNIGLSLKMGYSSVTNQEVNLDLSKKIHGTLNTNNFAGVVFDSFKNGKHRTTNLYTVAVDNTTNIVSIEEIGTLLDIFNQKITINDPSKRESSFVENFAPIAKYFGTTVNLNTKEKTSDIKSILNVDIKKGIPQITYFDKSNILTLESISRFGLLQDAKIKYVTEEQAKTLGITPKPFNSNGITYNGRLIDKFTGGTQYFSLPTNYKSIISVGTDTNDDKLFFYKTTNDELELTTIGDLNFNTSYIIVDKNGENIFSQNHEKRESVSLNFHSLNKLTGGNSKVTTIKLKVDRKDIKKIISIDKEKNSIELTYENSEGKIVMKEIGMTLGDFESTVDISLGNS